MARQDKPLCPHCQHDMRIRSSSAISITTRTNYFQCTNIACGATFSGVFSITHEICPSATPNPSVAIPAATPDVLRQVRKDMDEAKQENQVDWVNEGAWAQGC